MNSENAQCPHKYKIGHFQTFVKQIISHDSKALQQNEQQKNVCFFDQQDIGHLITDSGLMKCSCDKI